MPECKICQRETYGDTSGLCPKCRKKPKPLTSPNKQAEAKPPPSSPVKRRPPPKPQRLFQKNESKRAKPESKQRLFQEKKAPAKPKSRHTESTSPTRIGGRTGKTVLLAKGITRGRQKPARPMRQKPAHRFGRKSGKQSSANEKKLPHAERNLVNSQPPRPLIINYIWVSEGKPLEKVAIFNILSWRALGHSVTIYTHHVNHKNADVDEELRSYNAESLGAGRGRRRYRTSRHQQY